MTGRLKRFLGFPYPAEYEEEYNRDLMRSMHKPLLVAVVATLLFVTWLAGICVFWPETIAPPQYISGMLRIHFAFMVFTLFILLLTVGLRRQLFERPRLHVALCNYYAIGVCLWSTVLSAYADYSASVYTAFVFVMLCVSMVSLFKPWLAILSYVAIYNVYYVLTEYFNISGKSEPTSQLFNAGLSAIIGMVIAIAFYRFRTRTFYDKKTIDQQMEKINDINRQLQELLYIDTLTGLFNRKFYDETLPQELTKMAAQGNFCCMMLDVDHFKAYNDHYGHQAGDECLRRVATHIQEALPAACAFAVRYGGEEFFVLSLADDAEAANAVAEAIRSGVEDANIGHVAAAFGRVTISCGLLFCEQSDHWQLDTVTRMADEAMYRAKQSGRNQIVLYD